MNNDLIRRGELAEEVKSLTMYVNGLRAGKGVLQEYAKQYRDSLLHIIEEQPAVDAVPVSVHEQIRWERDQAMQQLKDHGIPFGGVATDVVEVVRCRDCESATHCEEEGEPARLVCPMWGANCDEDEFCSRGERRKENA